MRREEEFPHGSCRLPMRDHTDVVHLLDHAQWPGLGTSPSVTLGSGRDELQQLPLTFDASKFMRTKADEHHA
jgi:hypothetical protein